MNIPASDNLHLKEEAGGVTIPFEHNRNDKGSLFAGSIYAGAILAAYRAAERLFAERELGGDLVAKTATVSYLRRIVSDGRATASPQGEPVCKPNGNRVLRVAVAAADAAGVPCAELTAELVLMKDRTQAPQAREEKGSV